MSNNHDNKQSNRVFSRLGARELTPQEAARGRAASLEHTSLFTLLTWNPHGPLGPTVDGDNH
jgi:hypothetical protein